MKLNQVNKSCLLVRSEARLFVIVVIGHLVNTPFRSRSSSSHVIFIFHSFPSLHIITYQHAHATLAPIHEPCYHPYPAI